MTIDNSSGQITTGIYMLANIKNFISGFFAHIDIVKSLVLRETRTSFGRDNLGYIWAFVAPLAWIGTFLVIFSIGKRHPPSDMDPVGFLSTGLLPYIMFRAITAKSMKAINANKTLLYFPQIRPIDLIIARTSLESTLHIVILGILLITNIIYTGDIPLDNPFMFISGLILMILLSASFGLTLSSLTKIFKSLDHLISPILRPLLWISGIFFSASELPADIRKLFLWNPLLHIIEIIRSGWFKSYNSEYYDVNYVLIFIIIFTATGLTLERVTRRTIEV